jgi:glycosyltransferase involved in cell wall biosynthesis
MYADSMRILLASEFFYPSVGGAQEVVRQVATRLAARGHDVTVATSARSDRTALRFERIQIAEFAVSGNAAHGMTGEVDKYRNFIINGNFDAFFTYAAQQWTTDAALPLLEQTKLRTYLAPCGFSGLHRNQYTEYFANLKHQLDNFTGLIFHSDTYQDIEFARAAGCSNIHVISNAADEREFESVEANKDLLWGEFGLRREFSRLIINVGSHTGVKGHSEAMEVFRRSRECRHTNLLIAANSLGGRGCRQTCPVHKAIANTITRDRHITIRDLPRSQVVEALKAADLMVMTSLIECSPLVLFEAAAAGTPFVANDVGNAREIAEWTGGGIVVPPSRKTSVTTHPNIRRIRNEVDTLLKDDARRKAMGATARTAFLERFSWERVVDQYESVLLGQ